MTLHKEGVKTVALGLVGAFVTVLITAKFAQSAQVIYAVAALVGALLFFLVYFFRNPVRELTSFEGILSPADGTVVVIEETTESEYLNERCIQVSIFMSPLNVHVNRNPVTGTVEQVTYHPGKYLVAWHPKSSTENERTTVVYQTKTGKIVLRQIAGAMARRIVTYLSSGQQVKQGEQMGFIKFGSRIDLFLPLDTQLAVSLNQKVTGGITKISV